MTMSFVDKFAHNEYILNKIPIHRHLAPCATHEFQCSNGLCIDSIDQCNGIKDCLDGSDEHRCDKCHNDAFQ